MVKINDVLNKLENVRKNGDGYMAECPSHDDSNPSLSITEGDDGKVLLHCHAGCAFEDVVTALDLEVQDFFPKKKPKSKVVASYAYADEHGKIIYEVVRLKPKSFFQRRPDGKGGWVNGLGDVQPVLYRLPDIISAIKHNQTVFIVEGEKDVETLMDMALTGTCNPMGAGKWRDPYSDYLKGASVAILPDKDKPGRDHALKVAHSLQEKASSIKIVELPGLKDKGDVTDWFETGGTRAQLMELVEHSPEWTPEQQQEILDSDDPTRFMEGRDFIPKRLADELMGLYHIRYYADKLWLYQNGVYKPDGEQLLAREAQRLLDEESRSGRIKETMEYLKRECHATLPEPDCEYINLLNGRLKWIEKNLEPHDPSIFEIVQLPVAYDPYAICPYFDNYLNTTLDEEVIDLAEELFGFSLIPYTAFEKAIMLTGSGANGKSVFLDTLQALAGLENVSNVELQELEENRFKSAELLGKTLNVFADLDDRQLKSSSMFKVLVSGDRITGERKFGQPFSFKNHARLLFSANRLPTNTDRSHGFYRRWIIIPFTKNFNGQNADKDLRSKLQNELPGILNRALNGLHRLFDNEEFTMPEQVTEALENYKRDSDSVEAFIADKVVIGAYQSVPKRLFYFEYRNWCEEQGLRPFSQKKLKETLLRVIPDVKEQRDGSYGSWRWVGINID